MQQVEATLGELGRNCNTRMLERKVEHLRAMDESLRTRGMDRALSMKPNILTGILTTNLADSDRYVLASQLAVLRSCPVVVSRLLRKGGSVLVASKVLVISRLLHNVLSQRPNPPPYVESLRNRLATLRRKLLNSIDRRLKEDDATVEDLVEAMGAFSLATSSSATDVLKHFLHVRLQAMSSLLSAQDAGHQNAAKALSLFIRTLHDTRSVVPHKLADVLAKLKSSPLLKSPEFHDLIELNLVVHERWIGQQIKAFTPYLRHDDLRKAEAEKLLKQWAEDALSGFVDGLESILGRIEDSKVAVDLRRHLLEIWFSDHHHIAGVDIAGVDSAKVIDSLRKSFNTRLVQLMDTEIQNLGNVGSAIESTLQNWRDVLSDSSLSLWDVSMTSMDTTHGAGAFKSALISRSQGLTDPVQKVLHIYISWLDQITAFESLIAQLRASRWEDDVDDLDDDDNLLDNKQTLLSEDDPRTLQDHLEAALANAFASLQSQLQTCVTAIVSASPQQGPKTTFLLRVLRSLRQHLPSSYRSPDFGLSLIPTLHATLAATVLQTPLNNYTTRITQSSKRKRVPGRALWQGEPELPMQPSPSSFRFLQELCGTMADVGGDAWSPAATGVLKTRLREGLAEYLPSTGHSSEGKLSVNGDATGHTNGEKIASGGEEEEEAQGGVEEEMANPSAIHSVPSPSSDQDHDFEIQLLFDLHYILAATFTSLSSSTSTSSATSSQPHITTSSEKDSLLSNVSALEERIELSPAEKARVRKGAEEYWKRTALLFALLG